MEWALVASPPGTGRPIRVGLDVAATVCLWRQHTDDRWHTGEIEFPAGPDPDGAERLFAVLKDATPLAYRRFAEIGYPG